MSLTSNSKMSTKTLTSLAMLTALAYIVMLLCKGFPKVIGILQFDLTDTILCIGGFIYGPMAAAILAILVPLIEMFTASETGIIGMIMNILSSASFCCTASYIDQRRHTKQGAVIALVSGVLAMTAVMLLWNYLITPIYQKVPREVVIEMLPTVFLPFNLVKGGLNMGAILLVYKPVVTAMRKAGLIPPSTGASGKKFNAGFLLFTLALLATFVVWALVLLKII